jgi:uncharacterized protein (TIGR02646 family)
MVRLGRRPPTPHRLTRYKANWTERWRRIANRDAKGDWATRAAKKILRGALEDLTHGKCAFCESRPRATGDVEIEHCIAKTTDIDLAFEWANLLPACHNCNRTKGDTNPPNTAIRPDRDDPELYFWINPANGELEPLSDSNAAMVESVGLTVDLFDLNRGELCVNRLHLMEIVKRWWQRVKEAGENVPPDLAEELREFVDPKTHHKLALRQILKQAALTDLVEIDRRGFEQRAD